MNIYNEGQCFKTEQKSETREEQNRPRFIEGIRGLYSCLTFSLSLKTLIHFYRHHNHKCSKKFNGFFISFGSKRKCLHSKLYPYKQLRNNKSYFRGKKIGQNSITFRKYHSRFSLLKSVQLTHLVRQNLSIANTKYFLKVTPFRKIHYF